MITHILLELWRQITKSTNTASSTRWQHVAVKAVTLLVRMRIPLPRNSSWSASAHVIRRGAFRDADHGGG